MHYRLFILLLFILGCTPLPELVESPAVPAVISMSSLPPLTETSQGAIPEFSAIFLIRKDGTVDEVKLLSTSGDPNWDRAAIDSLKNWRFTSPPDDIAVNGRWIRYRIRIEIEDPLYLNLGEIVAFSKEEADSLYQILKKGEDFLTIADQIREGTTTEIGMHLGTVNIAQYPEHVRNTLRNLRVNRFTRPIKVGDTYVIYKKFEDQKLL